MMSRTETLLRERPALYVSLPLNDLEFARAAVAGGADGLKVHLNVFHHAAGNHFGTWEEEAPVIKQILELGVPVGMVPGTRERTITPREAREIEAAGVDFIDSYLQDMPNMVLEIVETLAVMAALSWREEAKGWGLGELEGRCSMLEASVVHPDGYGQPLAPHDLSSYREIVERYPDLPAIVPTQRALLPREVQRVLATGVRGILIGAIVTGQTAESIQKATEEFKAAM